MFQIPEFQYCDMFLKLIRTVRYIASHDRHAALNFFQLKNFYFVPIKTTFQPLIFQYKLKFDEEVNWK